MKRIVTLAGLLILMVFLTAGCNEQDLQKAYKSELNRANQKMTELKASPARKLANNDYRKAVSTYKGALAAGKAGKYTAANADIRKFYSEADRAIAKGNRAKDRMAREKEAAAEREALARERAAAKKVRTYVVHKGDWLSKISSTKYGDVHAWPKIYNANKSIIKDPNLIYPGQRLVIP